MTKIKLKACLYFYRYAYIHIGLCRYGSFCERKLTKCRKREKWIDDDLNCLFYEFRYKKLDWSVLDSVILLEGVVVINLGLGFKHTMCENKRIVNYVVCLIIKTNCCSSRSRHYDIYITCNTPLCSVLEITNEILAPEDANGEIAGVNAELLPIVFCSGRQRVQGDDVGVHVARVEENVGEEVETEPDGLFQLFVFSQLAILPRVTLNYQCRETVPARITCAEREFKKVGHVSYEFDIFVDLLPLVVPIDEQITDRAIELGRVRATPIRVRLVGEHIHDAVRKTVPQIECALRRIILRQSETNLG